MPVIYFAKEPTALRKIARLAARKMVHVAPLRVLLRTFSNQMRQKLIVLMSVAIRRITNIVARPWGNVPHSNVKKVFTSGKMQSLGIANHGNATRRTRKTEISVVKKSMIATAMQASVLPERYLSPMRQMSHVKVRNAQKKHAAFTQLAVCIMIAPTTLS
jgi:hypothetical protein